VPSEIAPYLNYGVLGLVVLSLIMGWVWAKPAVEHILSERDRLAAEKLRAEEQRDAAINIAQEKIVPLLTSFVATTQTLIPLLQELLRERGDDRHDRRG
jgi:hypothetical protein